MLLWIPPLHAQRRDLSGIAHVAFRVADYEKSRAYYEGLGFEQAFEFADPGKPRVSYIKVNDRQFIELYEAATGSQLGFMHICFESADLQSLHAAYVSEGLQPTEAKKFRAGNLLFTMNDPEGQLLEFTQYLPGSLHSNEIGKHLGAHRISGHLQGSSTPAKNLGDQKSFYASKLGFRAVPRSEKQLELLGKSQDAIELLQGVELKPRIVFAVSSLKQTVKMLRRRHLTVKALQKKQFYVEDPDGTLVMFTVPSF